MRFGWTDERLGRVMANLLRAGVILAAGWVLVGGFLYLTKYSSALPDYRVFRGEPTDLRHVSGIVEDALALCRRGMIQLGLLLLIATPIARVAFSALAFVLERDWLYVLVTLTVLALLLYSLVGGRL